MLHSFRLVLLLPVLSLIAMTMGACQAGEPGQQGAGGSSQLAQDSVAAPPTEGVEEVHAPDTMSEVQIRRFLSLIPPALLNDTIKLEGEQFSLDQDSLFFIKAMDGYQILWFAAFQNGPASPVVVKENEHDFHVSACVVDANFDGRTDVVINYYSGTGCCPRLEGKVYLNKAKGFLQQPVDVFNACFNQVEKAVYTMDYGFPPFCSLSKSIWEADTLRLVESVYYPVEDEEDVESPDTMYLFDDQTGDQAIILEVPEPYHCIPGAEGWFIPLVSE